MGKPIILVKAPKYIRNYSSELFAWQTTFVRQMNRDGLILVPNDFEVAIVDSDNLDCVIELLKDDSKDEKEPKKHGRFFQKVFSRKNKP